MAIRAELPDGRVLEFPDGTDQAVIQATVKRMLGVDDEVEQQNLEPTGSPDPDVPTTENLLLDDIRMQKAKAEKGDRSAMDYLTGLGESLLTIGTGATGGTLGTIVGSAEGIVKEKLGQVEDGAKVAQERASQLTYQPRSEVGQEIVKELGDFLGVLPPVIGTAPITPIRAGQLTKTAIQTPKIKRRILAEQIKSGNPNIETVTKMISDGGRIVTNKTAKRALKVLQKDLGQDRAVGTVSVIENMTPATKKRLTQMLDTIEKGRKEPLWGQTNRPSDILGDAVADRARAVATINKREGQRIGQIAKSIDKPVSITKPAADFVRSLREMGVDFKKGDDGWITADFSRSKFMGGSQKDMNVLINDLAKGTMKFEDAHKLKRMIRYNIDFDATGPGQIKGESQQLLKRLSSGIDEVLDSESSDYRVANEKFAQTINIKERFDKLSGGEIDIFDDAASKTLGGKTRRLVSNAQSRVEIEQLIRDSEDALSNMGIKFKDDISGLNYAVTQLENAFKIEPPRSFQGGIQRAATNVAQGINPTGAAIETVLSKVNELSAPDFNKKMRAFRSLAQQGLE